MKKMLNSLLLVAFVAGTFSTGYAAEDKKPKKPVDKAAQFKRLDKDKDGKLSKDEFVATRKTDEAKEKAGKQFTRLDKDKDGSISEKEFSAAPERKKKKPE